MATANQYSHSFFGHPRGLATLFFTEMWERFSYYGMRALLILYMTADTSNGGLQFDVVKASAIYGLYTSMVYMTGLPGGWIADKFLGQRSAVLFGGIIIALGHFSMAFHSVAMFFVGLALIVCGTGLLKPNISAIVGALYEEKDARRDAGFSIFYMGINLGALIAPLICGYLGQRVDWHYGFGAAGLGMTFGVIQYALGGKYLGEAGLKKANTDAAAHSKNSRTLGLTLAGVVALVCIAYLCLSSGFLDLSSMRWVYFALLSLIVIAFFANFFLQKDWTPVERKRIGVIAILFIFTTMFWGAFEQAGSTLNLFADRYTDNSLFGFAFPSSWFQSVNSIFLIAFAPVFAWLWVKLGKNEPSSPAKFAMGLFFVGLGYLLLVPAALIVTNHEMKAGPYWLIGLYLCHTFGELSLSPVGLSMVTKLAPARIVGQMMGIWFMTISLGNFVGSMVAGKFETFPLPALFGTVFATTVGAALLLALLVKPIKKMMGGVN